MGVDPEMVQKGTERQISVMGGGGAAKAAIPAVKAVSTKAVPAAKAGLSSLLSSAKGMVGKTANAAPKTSLSKLATGAKVVGGVSAAGGAGYGALKGYQVLTGKNNLDDTDELPNEIIKEQTNPNPDPAKSGLDGGSGGGLTREQKERVKLIGAGWDDMEDELSNTTRMVSDYAGELSGRLGGLRKSYLSAIDESERQDNESITGQKTLVDKERNTELGKVAADARKGFFQANTRYGGPQGSSAGMMAQKGVQGMAEKSRKEVLDEVGVMLSELGQKEQEVKITSERQRKDVYDMEKQLKDEAMAEYADSMKALKRLKEKKSGWKQKDIDSQSDSYLAKLANSIATISAQAKMRRDQIHSAEYEIGNQIKDLRQKAALTFAPPELDADKIDLGEAINPGQDEEDFFNPNAEERKRISSKVKNILDELDQEGE